MQYISGAKRTKKKKNNNNSKKRTKKAQKKKKSRGENYLTYDDGEDGGLYIYIYIVFFTRD